MLEGESQRIYHDLGELREQSEDASRGIEFFWTNFRTSRVPSYLTLHQASVRFLGKGLDIRETCSLERIIHPTIIDNDASHTKMTRCLSI